MIFMLVWNLVAVALNFVDPDMGLGLVQKKWLRRTKFTPEIFSVSL
jgi:hypothetical protein